MLFNKFDCSAVVSIILTLLKTLVTFAIIYYLFVSEIIASVLIIIFVVCNIFDGTFFRQSFLAHNQSFCRIRRVIDVTGDRMAIHGVFLTMIFACGFPVIYYLIIISREFLLLAVNKRRIVEPNNYSRIGIAFIGFVAIFWLLSNSTGAFYCMMLMILFSIIGAWKYHHSSCSGT